MCLSSVYRITTALLLLTQHGEPSTALVINAHAHQRLSETKALCPRGKGTWTVYLSVKVKITRGSNRRTDGPFQECPLEGADEQDIFTGVDTAGFKVQWEN